MNRELFRPAPKLPLATQSRSEFGDDRIRPFCFHFFAASEKLLPRFADLGLRFDRSAKFFGFPAGENRRFESRPKIFVFRFQFAEQSGELRRLLDVAFEKRLSFQKGLRPVGAESFDERLRRFLNRREIDRVRDFENEFFVAFRREIDRVRLIVEKFRHEIPSVVFPE